MLSEENNFKGNSIATWRKMEVLKKNNAQYIAIKWKTFLIIEKQVDQIHGEKEGKTGQGVWKIPKCAIATRIDAVPTKGSKTSCSLLTWAILAIISAKAGSRDVGPK